MRITLADNLPDDRIVRKGTRHALMVRLASKARRDGLVKDACQEMLALWYERQNPALIDSTRAEVERDIRRITKWTYGATYANRVARPKEIHMDADDLRLVLGHSCKSLRKTLFLLIALQKARISNVSTAKLGALIGVSSETIRKNKLRLERDGIITTIGGTSIRNDDGSFYRPGNTYRVSIDRKSNRPANTQIPQVTLSVDALMASFTEIYYDTIIALMKMTGIESNVFVNEKVQQMCAKKSST